MAGMGAVLTVMKIWEEEQRLIMSSQKPMVV